MKCHIPYTPYAIHHASHTCHIINTYHQFTMYEATPHTHKTHVQCVAFIAQIFIFHVKKMVACLIFFAAHFKLKLTLLYPTISAAVLSFMSRLLKLIFDFHFVTTLKVTIVTHSSKFKSIFTCFLLHMLYHDFGVWSFDLLVKKNKLYGQHFLITCRIKNSILNSIQISNALQNTKTRNETHDIKIKMQKFQNILCY